MVVGAVVVVVAAIVVIVKSGRREPVLSGVASDAKVRIPVGGGVSLTAEVVTPRGPGRFPLVVMPTSWGSDVTEYHGLAGVLARDGYQVVTYVQRGFHQSGGQADFAGPPTRRDVSTVIDWAVKHTRGDVTHVGLFGTSYGAGISLLAAARDPRIKVVVATSGWADFGDVFAGNDTVSSAALGALLGAVTKSGRPADALAGMAATLRSSRPADAAAQLRSMSPIRSADREIAALNRNQPAIMLASAYQDSVLPPLSLISFFDRLKGPKRLQLAPGEHGAPESAGLSGRPNAVTDQAHEWLDHHLKGEANGIAPAVQFTDTVTHAVTQYAKWPVASARVLLGRPDGATPAASAAAKTWTQAISGGTDTTADAVPGSSGPNGAYHPASIRLNQFDTAHGVYWTRDPVAANTVLDGAPRLSLSVSASTGSASLFTYLYDVDADGRASLMSATPYTVTGAMAGPKRISFDLGPIGWTLAQGHRLALVIDTVDPRWAGVTPPGSTVRFSSAAAAPATLTLPLSS